MSRRGMFNVGLLTMQVQSTATTPNNNYTVVRVRRDVLGGSDVGAIFMTRQSTDDGRDF